MLNVIIYCTNCGRKLRKTIDDTCPPSQLHCECGARFPLHVDTEEPSMAGLGAATSDGEEADLLTGRSTAPSW